MKEAIDIVLSKSEDFTKSRHVEKEEFNKLGFEYTDKYSEHNIPLMVRCPSYSTNNIKGFVNKLEKLSSSGVSKTIYSKIGLLEENKDGSSELVITCLCIIEPRFRKFNEEELNEIINNDDPEYKIV